MPDSLASFLFKGSLNIIYIIFKMKQKQQAAYFSPGERTTKTAEEVLILFISSVESEKREGSGLDNAIVVLIRND